MEYNFEKHSPDSVSLYGSPYDYGSIMHYAASTFSRNQADTLRATDQLYQHTIGQRLLPSFVDVKLVNHVYCSRLSGPDLALISPDLAWSSPDLA